MLLVQFMAIEFNCRNVFATKITEESIYSFVCLFVLPKDRSRIKKDTSNEVKFLFQMFQMFSLLLP